MRTETLLTLTLSACAALCGCFDSDEVPDPATSEDGTGTATGDEADNSDSGPAPLPDMGGSGTLFGEQDEPPPAPVPKRGSLWGPCWLTDDGDEVGGWGCKGVPGEGYACLFPGSLPESSICVPQVVDPDVPDDCEGLTEPGFGIGVEPVLGYCVPRCKADADCLATQVCAPVLGVCGWL